MDFEDEIPNYTDDVEAVMEEKTARWADLFLLTVQFATVAGFGLVMAVLVVLLMVLAVAAVA